MLGRGNEIVVTVDPVREEAKSRQEEVRAAAKNDGSGLREWIVEEAAWLVAQFTNVALSVAVVRGVHQLFRIGYASESAYQRAPDLWSHGHQQQDTPGCATLIRAAPLAPGDVAAEVLVARLKVAGASIRVPMALVRKALGTSSASVAIISTCIARSLTPAGSGGPALFCM